MSVCVFKSICYFVSVVSLNLFLRVGVFVLCLRLTFFSVFVNLSFFSSTSWTYVFVLCVIFLTCSFLGFPTFLIVWWVFPLSFSDSAASFYNIFLFSLILSFFCCVFDFFLNVFFVIVSLSFSDLFSLFLVFFSFFFYLFVFFCSFPLFSFLIRFLIVKVLQQIGGLSKLMLWSLVI